MGGHLCGVSLGVALALTAAAASLALGLLPSHGGVMALLMAVLVASRSSGPVAGYAATVTGAVLSLGLLAAGAADSATTGSHAGALVMLGLIGTGIAAWTGQRPSAAQPPPTELRRVKEEFLATVSHELRTPLNAILGWTELLRMRRAVPPQQVDRGLEVIERNARHQLALVEELLAAAEPGTLSEDWATLDVRLLLESVVDGITAAATRADVVIALDALSSGPAPGKVVPVWVRGDEASLRIAIRHVLDNAVKYSNRGGDVHIRLRLCGGQVLLFVSDEGGGIETSKLVQVFEPFSQGDSSAARRFGGLGLGLTIARKLIERHGGHIDLRSSGVSGGSTVLVTLPSARAGTAA